MEVSPTKLKNQSWIAFQGLKPWQVTPLEPRFLSLPGCSKRYDNTPIPQFSIKAVCREQTLREIRLILTSACLEYSSTHWYFSCQILDNLQHCQNMSKLYGRPLCGGFQNIDAHRRTSTYAHMYIHVHTKHIRMHTICLGG